MTVVPALGLQRIERVAGVKARERQAALMTQHHVPYALTLRFKSDDVKQRRISVGKIVTIEYVDDLAGVSIDPSSVDSVRFSYRGQDYTLILTRENGAQFDKDISRYIKAAKKAQSRDARAAQKAVSSTSRKVDARVQASRRKPARSKVQQATRSGPERTRAIRQWASENGHNISARGRIPAAIIAAYDAAH